MGMLDRNLSVKHECIKTEDSEMEVEKKIGQVSNSVKVNVISNVFDCLFSFFFFLLSFFFFPFWRGRGEMS